MNEAGQLVKQLIGQVKHLGEQQAANKVFIFSLYPFIVIKNKKVQKRSQARWGSK